MNNEKLREEQEQEAIKRINQLTKLYGLNSNMLEEFKNNHVYAVSIIEKDITQERINQIIKFEENFEEKYNATIYYCIISNLEWENETNEILSVFYVGKHKDEWESIGYPENNEIFVYSYNLDHIECSEFGYIGIDVNNRKDLIRTH